MGLPNAVYDGNGGDESGPDLSLWMLSDIQPEDEAARVDFELAVADMNDNVEKVDLAVIAGDIFRSRSQPRDLEWFRASQGKSRARVWYEIAGNHDVRSKDIFSLFFTRPPYYGVRVGNLLLLFLSDESVASMTTISDEAFDWWREMVRNNRELIVVTVTHAYLRSSGLLGSAIKSRQIDQSDRFEQVLREEKVVLWASGHSHLPHGLVGTVNRKNSLGGTIFVNVASIDTGRLLDSQSRLFLFRQGSDTVWMRSRNHTKGRFEPTLDYTINLGKPFSWDGSEPRLILPGQ